MTRRCHLFFDIDGTLVDYDDAVARAVRHLIASIPPLAGLDPAAFAVRWRSLRSEHTRDRLDGRQPLASQRRERMARLLAELEVVASPAQTAAWSDQLTHLATSGCRAYPDVVAVLSELVPVSCGVVTNGDPDVQRAKLSASRLPIDLSPFVASIERGVQKPDAEIFRAAAAEAGRDPADCLHVGDSLHFDVLPALSAGWQAVWLDRQGECSPPPDVVTLSSLSELPALLETRFS